MDRKVHNFDSNIEQSRKETQAFECNLKSGKRMESKVLEIKFVNIKLIIILDYIQALVFYLFLDCPVNLYPSPSC